MLGQSLSAEQINRSVRDAYSYSFYLFNPGKMMLVPNVSVGPSAGFCGSMTELQASSKLRESREVKPSPINLRLY
jgi:hypothetical protein